MIIVPKMPAGRGARIWLGELPATRYAAEWVSNQRFQSDRPAPAQARLGAVELFHHVGPYIPYGLLGATHHPSVSAGRELTVLVHVSTPSGATFTESLAGSFDTVQIGLPHEYVRGVIDGVSEVHREVGGLAAGKLVFDCAAHGVIGSSLAFFQRLSRVVCRLLCVEEGTLSQNEALSCLEILQ